MDFWDFMNIDDIVEIVEITNFWYIFENKNESQYCGGILKLSINHWVRDFLWFKQFPRIKSSSNMPHVPPNVD